ncbi:hypothetical protein Sjap_001266 [Stephania japonica]|uniref:Ubiquitin thioesterase OTU n=1 Tax=Stephania japonica TaxID=461633 RepID=A0AAP0KJM8_9MAGN
MLLALCARPKPWILSALSCASLHRTRFAGKPLSLSFVHIAGERTPRRRPHTSQCGLDGVSGGGGAASIWHAILPSGNGCSRRSDCRRPAALLHELRGEGSWNVAWDVRPARWLHGSDSAWLLFGVCACLAPTETATDYCVGGNPEVDADGEVGVGADDEESGSGESDELLSEYRVTGVLADGRCLFRAVAHGACLRNGQEAPDEDRQRELADELRVQVVDELVKRRKETEWSLEEDFDAYVKNIQEPCTWGGELEVLMASHVLKTPISVFMTNGTSGKFIQISSYGEEYGKDDKGPIQVLFHRYGHYDVLETISRRSHPKVER